MNTVCKNPDCGKKIIVSIFLGEDYCSVDCKKALGLDDATVGTMKLVRPGEMIVPRNAVKKRWLTLNEGP